MKKKLSDSTEIRIKYAEEHALRVLEERNIAFRVLYDTVLEVEGACEETIFGILCRNLRRIAKAKWAALASYAPHRSTFTLEAVSTEDDRAADPGKYSSPGITVPVNETVVENFLQSQIRECSHEVCLVSLFPGSILNRASHTGDSMCYRISFIREKTLIAAGMVQLPDGQTLKMKDLVNTYLNLAGMILQRINEVNALRKSEEQYRRIFDSVTDCLIVFDLNGNIVEANPAACRLYGYTRDEMVQLSGQDIMSRDYHHVFQNLKESLFSVGKFHSQSVDVRKDGSLMNIDIQGTTFEYNGAPHILAIIRDVTERKKMENELMKIQKLESLGILAGGIAHDFNNMLNAIIGNLNLARTFFDQKEKTLERIQNAEKVAYEATSLSKQLLTFSKGGVPVKKIVSLPKLLKEASEFTLAGSNVSARTQIPEDLKSVEADAGQIKQIVQNLVVNARQAMPDGGIVRIECDNVSLPSDNSLALDQGEYVRVCIADTGVGIPEKYLKKIFDPYFTTKQDGHGLGLATVFSIIQKHGGNIAVQSSPGEGTRFEFFLPAASGPAKGKKEEGNRKIRGEGHVLVMDDEAFMRDLLNDGLSAFGFRVTLAKNGEEAVETYRKAHRAGIPPDVVLLDLTVRGGMGGRETLEALKEIDPGVKAVVISGYADDRIVADPLAYGFTAALSKPCYPNKVAQVIHSVLTRD